MEYYAEHWEVARSLAPKLGLEYQPCQDWEFTTADPEKIGPWLEVIESDPTLSPNERTLLLNVLIASYEQGYFDAIDMAPHRDRLVRAIDAVPEDRARMHYYWVTGPHVGDDPDAEVIIELFR